ncbi:MAG: hypothetical protein Q8L48_16875 [Archangium sp.]|nr:hypothetical protein [Archangium sp.]
MRSSWLGLLLVLMACPAEVAKPVIVDAGVVELDAGSPVDAGPPPPSSLEPTVVASFADGGTTALTAESQIDAAKALTISLPIKLKDFRIRLLDYREQIVVSDDELMADGRTYVITLPEPLKTGRGYNLVLDAELGPIVTDDSGGTWNDWELPFRIAGDAQPEPVAGKKKPQPKKKK